MDRIIALLSRGRGRGQRQHHQGRASKRRCRLSDRRRPPLTSRDAIRRDDRRHAKPITVEHVIRAWKKGRHETLRLHFLACWIFMILDVARPLLNRITLSFTCTSYLVQYFYLENSESTGQATAT